MTDKDLLDQFIEENYADMNMDDDCRKAMSQTIRFAEYKIRYYSGRLKESFSKDLLTTSTNAKKAFQKLSESLTKLKNKQP